MTDDETQIRAVITECYAMISGPAGPRDWSRQYAIFHPDCIQMRTSLDADGKSQVLRMGLDEYSENASKIWMDMDFHELELDCRVDVFGNMAQAWSLYEAKHHPDDAVPERRGINSFQFFKDADGRWLIMSMIWDNEREGVSLPLA
jgi:ketosteroid isomerase-like protein